MNETGYPAHGEGALNPDYFPTDCDIYVTADCGHEVYRGELFFESESRESLCPDCIEDKFYELPLLEKAELLGFSFSRVV